MVLFAMVVSQDEYSAGQASNAIALALGAQIEIQRRFNTNQENLFGWNLLSHYSQAIICGRQIYSRGLRSEVLRRFFNCCHGRVAKAMS